MSLASSILSFSPLYFLFVPQETRLSSRGVRERKRETEEEDDDGDNDEWENDMGEWVWRVVVLLL